jgi:hypothetical protein
MLALHKGVDFVRAAIVVFTTFVVAVAVWIAVTERRAPEPAWCVNHDRKVVDDGNCERAERLMQREGIVSSRYKWYFGGVGSPGSVVSGGSYAPAQRVYYRSSSGKLFTKHDCSGTRRRRRPGSLCWRAAAQQAELAKQIEQAEQAKQMEQAKAKR